jgi:hypothetical protein
VLAGFGGKAFTTAVVAELDTDNGQLQRMSAGHPEPLLLPTAGSSRACTSTRHRRSVSGTAMTGPARPIHPRSAPTISSR